MTSEFTEIISLRVDDKLLYQIKNNLRTGENLSDFIRKAVRSYLAIVQTHKPENKRLKENMNYAKVITYPQKYI